MVALARPLRPPRSHATATTHARPDRMLPSSSATARNEADNTGGPRRDAIQTPFSLPLLGCRRCSPALFRLGDSVCFRTRPSHLIQARRGRAVPDNQRCASQLRAMPSSTPPDARARCLKMSIAAFQAVIGTAAASPEAEMMAVFSR